MSLQCECIQIFIRITRLNWKKSTKFHFQTKVNVPYTFGIFDSSIFNHPQLYPHFPPKSYTQQASQISSQTPNRKPDIESIPKTHTPSTCYYNLCPIRLPLSLFNFALEPCPIASPFNNSNRISTLPPTNAKGWKGRGQQNASSFRTPKGCRDLGLKFQNASLKWRRYRYT